MICAIHQPQFLPWLGYFQKLNHSDIFVLLDDVQFRKNEFQNRNRICSPASVQWLTVPVSFRFGDVIRDVRISEAVLWQDKMLRTIEYCYRGTPFFGDYMEGFESVIRGEWSNLAELNAASVLWLKSCLKCDAQIVFASSLTGISSDRNQRLIDICQAVGASTYLSGALAKCYLDVAAFNDVGVAVRFQNFEHPVYPQGNCSNGFVSHMSAIDGLFNCGGQANVRRILHLC